MHISTGTTTSFKMKIPALHVPMIGVILSVAATVTGVHWVKFRQEHLFSVMIFHYMQNSLGTNRKTMEIDIGCFGDHTHAQNVITRFEEYLFPSNYSVSLLDKHFISGCLNWRIIQKLEYTYWFICLLL